MLVVPNTLVTMLQGLFTLAKPTANSYNKYINGFKKTIVVWKKSQK